MRNLKERLLFASSLVVFAFASAQAQEQGSYDWKRVEDALRRKGTMMPGEVYRFSMPRSDLKVTERGVEIKPAFVLGSWAAFKMSGEHARW